MSTPRISPLFEGKKGPLPPALVLCWTPAVRKQYPLPAPTNSFLKMFFFFSLPPSSPFPPSCYNVFSIFNPQSSKLPSSLQTLSDEWSFKNQNLNAWLLQFACLPSFILHQLLKSRQSIARLLNWFCLSDNIYCLCHSPDVCSGWTSNRALNFISAMLSK